MTRYALFTHIIFADALFVLACSICWLLIKRVRIMDIPNSRSSHDTPIPKGGGIVIVVTFLIGVTAIYFFGDVTMIDKNYFWGFILSSLLIAGVSFYDDLTNKPFLFKLICQMVAVLIVMKFGIVIHEISLPWAGKIQLGMWGYILTFLWIIGLTNAYNFMDGLNGMAAGPAVITASFLCVLSFNQGSTFVYIICYTIIAGALGFMVFNFPNAKLFMGDVGSAFLGFVFANLAIIASLYDHSHTSFFVIPLLLFNFIYDTSFTFIRRLLKKENVSEAHRTHLYQLFNQLGYNHVVVSCFHFGVCITQGIAATIMLKVEGDIRVLVFIPFLIFQILYSSVIINRAKATGLI